MTKNIFINLSNHPSNKWSPEQINAVSNLFGNEDVEIKDIGFPLIDSNNDLNDIRKLVDEYTRELSYIIPENNVIVHVMGEMVFTYNIVNKLINLGVRCVASTTERISQEDENGVKKSIFKFNKFRDYDTI